MKMSHLDMKRIQLNMNETKKYLVIKVIAQGKKTKKRACAELNLSERHSIKQ
ncbi:transposase [Streptococcus pneumoniae 27]|nr:transposase [Streptococcus pneumoniae 27]